MEKLGISEHTSYYNSLVYKPCQDKSKIVEQMSNILGRTHGDLWIKFERPDEILEKEFNLMLNRLEIGFTMAVLGSKSLPFGSGKSFTSMRIGEVIDKNFNIDKVCFTPSEFLTQQRLIREQIQNSNYTRHWNQVLVFDESAVSVPSAKWYSASNFAMAQANTVFRDLRSIGILVSHDWEWLDNRLKRSMLYKGFCSPSLTGKTHQDKEYRFYLSRIIRGDGNQVYGRMLRCYDAVAKRRVKIESFLVKAPSEELIEQYRHKANKAKGSIEKRAYEMSVLAERSVGINEEGQETGNPNQQRVIDEVIGDVLKNPIVQKTLAEKQKLSKEVIEYALLGKSLTGQQKNIITKMVRLQLNK